MKISILIGKPVLSALGEQLGYVKCVYVTKKLGLSMLECVDGEEEEFYLPARAIVSVGDAVITNGARLEEPVGQPSPIGKAVFTERGEYLGTVTDLTVEDKGSLTVRKDGTDAFFAATRAIIGDAIILKSERAPKAQKEQIKQPPSPKKAQETEIKTQSEESKDYTGNLLGRRVTENIIYKNMVFIPAGTVITAAVIRTAAAHNLLLALQKNSVIVF